MLIFRDRLFGPGPTAVPLSIKLAGLSAAEYHRTDEYYQDFLAVRRQLSPIFGTEELPIILTAAGSAAMEAAVVNFTEENDNVLVLTGGVFGKRWRTICDAYRCETIAFEFPLGESPDLDKLEGLVKTLANIKCVFFQACETSTGVALPVEQIVKLLKHYHPETLVVVDAISALIAEEVQMDRWQIDCMIGGSQKGLAIYPGLSFVVVSPGLWNDLSKRSKFYLNLKREYDGQAEGRASFTSSTILIYQLKESLQLIHQVGLANLTQHHQRNAKAVRAASAAMNLELFARSHHSSAVTSIRVPSGIDGKNLLKTLRSEFRCQFAGGQGEELVGKIFRFGHLGFIDALDITSGLSALELGLATLGHKFSLGAGVTAALKYFAN